MASIRTLFDTLLEEPLGTKLTVEVTDEAEYETLRVMLVKMWNRHKQVLGAIADEDPFLENSMCADFCSGEGNDISTATFYLGKPRRKKGKQYSFVVVSKTVDQIDNTSEILAHVIRPK